MATALVSVAGGIISGVAGPLASEQFKLYRGFKKELWKLESTVKAIEAVLEDAEAKQVQSCAVRDWLEKLNDVLYEADDLLDSVSTEALQGKVMTQGKKVKKVRIFFFKSKRLFNDLRMANKIKDIREKLDAIEKERNFHLDPQGPVERRVRFSRDTAAYLGEELIGREDDKKAVIELLDANDEVNVSILSIVGIGGLGKTSLAKLIFNDEEYTKKFDQKLWVCVSDEFDVKMTIKKIVENETDLMNALVNCLREKINGKRYFLVLDDVWNEDPGKWFELKNYLKSDVKGSKILVTTRSAKVANVMQTYHYELKGLDEDKSWDLFEQTAFENKEESIETRMMEEIGKEITRKCSGVPLAVKTVGWSLRSQSFQYWLSFRETELSSLSHQNFETDILSTLKLSYNKLPSRLKQCFAYCSLFPKDYMYDRITLISLWMAQGFVESRLDQCLEDVGDEYFKDLFFGSFFQEAVMDDLGDILSCKMHDLMHDLAMLVSKSLIAAVGDKIRRNISNKTRFLSFNDDTDFSTLEHSSFEASKIRTFIFPYHNNVKHINYEVIFSVFEHLRVLDLSNRLLECLPTSISKLKQLRDLNLSRNRFKQLPESIMLLQNLQTLNLCFCQRLEKLPSGIAKLINLRCLYLDSCDRLSSMPRGLGQLTNLHRLDSFVVKEGLPLLPNLHRFDSFVVKEGLPLDSSSLDELNGLVNLRGSLTICPLRHTDTRIYESADLSQISRLVRMSLEWGDVYGCVNDEVAAMSFKGLQPSPNLKILELLRYQFSELPSWISSLTSLVILAVTICPNCQYLTPLSQLRSLKNLKLNGMDDLEYVSKYRDTCELSSSSSSSPVFFPMLDTLELRFCPKLKGLWEADSSTGGKSDDTITEVTSLENLKFVHPIQHLTKLKHLDIQYCPNVELDNDENGMEWQGAPPLQTLNIKYCDSLRAIPKWVEDCKTLKVLEIRNCSHFNSQRCEKETGEDWPKIVHIPNFTVQDCLGSEAAEAMYSEMVETPEVTDSE